MNQAPSIVSIRQWIKKENPLGLFGSNRFFIYDIDPKPWSGHFNFLITVKKKRFVLRFKGPEWGEPSRGVLDEYKILKYVESYRVAPRAYYICRDFFGEPVMFEEYIQGNPLNSFSLKTQEDFFPEVIKLIARINKIPVRRHLTPFREPLLSYMPHKIVWRKRLKIILENSRTKIWGEKIKKLLPRAERMLDRFEPRLRRVMRRIKPTFIFKSVHAGHCMIGKAGIRFLNWEEISCGDPSYSLAVFLSSISRHPKFILWKDRLAETYLRENFVPEFRELLWQRLCERQISNLIWVVWAHIKKGGEKPQIPASIAIRFRAAETMLKEAVLV